MKTPRFEKLDKTSLVQVGKAIGLDLGGDVTKPELVSAVSKTWDEKFNSDLAESEYDSDVSSGVATETVASNKSEILNKHFHLNGNLRERLRRWIGLSKLEILHSATTLATLGILYVSQQTLTDSRENNARDDRRAIEFEIVNQFDHLIATEDRYRTNLLGSVMLDSADGGHEGLELEWTANIVGDSTQIFFQLPRTNLRLGAKETVRTRSVLVNDEPASQDYTVQVPVDSLVPVLPAFSAFGCVSCNSRSRLDVYLTLKQATKEMELREIYYVHLARGAVDFGETESAIRYLDLAIKQLAEVESVVELARVHEEIGKTYMVLQEFQLAEEHLKMAKGLWRSTRLSSQVGGLHDILNWEAQYASARGDRDTAESLLQEMSIVVSGYDLSKSKMSEMIHDAYTSCIVLLANSGVYDPKLTVPKEFVTYRPDFGGWVTPATMVESYRRSGYVPGGLTIHSNKLDRGGEPDAGCLNAEDVRRITASVLFELENEKQLSEDGQSENRPTLAPTIDDNAT